MPLMQQIATTKQILQFIGDLEFIQPWQLENEFGYTAKSAQKKIQCLRVAGLINNSIRGKWNLTTEGERRLEYYNAKDKEAARKGK